MLATTTTTTTTVIILNQRAFVVSGYWRNDSEDWKRAEMMRRHVEMWAFKNLLLLLMRTKLDLERSRTCADRLVSLEEQMFIQSKGKVPPSGFQINCTSTATLCSCIASYLWVRLDVSSLFRLVIPIAICRLKLSIKVKLYNFLFSKLFISLFRNLLSRNNCSIIFGD